MACFTERSVRRDWALDETRGLRHALDRKSVHAILARVEQFIRQFEKILADASHDGRAAIRNLNLAANIVTFLPTIVALRRWDLTRKVPKKEMIEGLGSR